MIAALWSDTASAQSVGRPRYLQAHAVDGLFPEWLDRALPRAKALVRHFGSVRNMGADVRLNR